MLRLTLFFLGIALFHFSAMASVARVNALQSNHLNSSEYVYLFPTKLLELRDYVIIKSGANTVVDPFQRPSVAFKASFADIKSDYYAVGITLGRQSDLADQARLSVNTSLSTNYDYTANPINFNYAVRSLGNSYSIGFFYAAKNDKVNYTENHAGTLNLGLRIDDFTLAATAGLFNTVDDQSMTHLSINQAFTGALVYELDDIQFILDLSSSRAKKTIGTYQSDSLEFLNYKMGIIKNYLNGEELLFYRLNLETAQIKNRITESTKKIVKLPLTLGFESSLNDMMVLRSSIKQIVGVFQSDDFPAGSNTTSAAVGLGLNFNKFTVDGTLQGLIGSTASQKINSNEFLTETSVSYWF